MSVKKVGTSIAIGISVLKQFAEWVRKVKNKRRERKRKKVDSGQPN